MDPTLRDAIASQTSFSLRLYTHLVSLPGFRTSNIAFSPLSLHAALSLMTAGSTGPTLQQLLSYLGFNTSSELSTLHAHISNVLLADGSSAGGPCIRYACGLWVDDGTNHKKSFREIAGPCLCYACHVSVDDGTNLKNSFREIAGSAYKAEAHPVPFRSTPKQCCDQINKWVEQATAGNIKNLLAPESVTKDTRLVLGNALYFKGDWHNKFDMGETRNSTFYLIDGSSINVPFMNHNGEHQYLSVHDEFKVLKLPYKKKRDWREFSFYMFLPNTLDGLLSLSIKLSSEPNFLDRHIPTERVQVRYFKIPKFKISVQTLFSDIFKTQGLVLPFTMTGDFSEMVTPEIFEYYVSEIAHKCSVGVNEEGTEAAAATTIMMRGGCLVSKLEPIDFVADHPFLFLIREDKSGVVLFAGQLLNPLLT